MAVYAKVENSCRNRARFAASVIPKPWPWPSMAHGSSRHHVKLLKVFIYTLQQVTKEDLFLSHLPVQVPTSLESFVAEATAIKCVFSKNRVLTSNSNGLSSCVPHQDCRSLLGSIFHFQTHTKAKMAA